MGMRLVVKSNKIFSRMVRLSPSNNCFPFTMSFRFKIKMDNGQIMLNMAELQNTTKTKGSAGTFKTGLSMRGSVGVVKPINTNALMSAPP